MTAVLSDRERADWLRLSRTENVGPATFRRLIEQFGTADAALQALPDLARRGGRRKPLKPPALAEIEREVASLDRFGGRFVALVEPDYPALLRAIEDPPPVIAIRGHVALASRRAVAIVGARNASLNGRRLAEMIAEGVGKAGCTVVSGLARGIDGAAHRASLATGTVAVLPGGIDVIYPPDHDRLHGEIAETGLLVSERPLGADPIARAFIRRNRLIAGLALGTVVVEAANKSGSLTTAHFALDYGREVFAVPGSPLDPRAHGTNGLLREGATLTEAPGDVLQNLPPAIEGAMADKGQGDLFDGLSPDRRRVPAAMAETLPADVDPDLKRQVLDCLGPSPLAVDEIIRECQVSPGLVLTVLLELELAGRLERHPGQKVSLLA